MRTRDVARFLEARLDEDEAAARATEHADGPRTLSWTSVGDRHLRFDNGQGERYSAVRCGEWDRILVARDGVRGGPIAAHIARHDPARVLADVAAKRQIVAWIGDYDADPDGSAWGILGHLAALYAAHPDYRQEWRSALDDESAP